MSRLLSRRQLLILTLGGCLSGLLAPAGGRERELSTFLDLSREMTGFEELDGALGQRYLDALSAWDPTFPLLLSLWAGGKRSGWSRSEGITIDLVIETWYTGTVPTARGTEVVTYEKALGSACLPRRTPVTFCR